jgi:hypothetical protein
VTVTLSKTAVQSAPVLNEQTYRPHLITHASHGMVCVLTCVQETLSGEMDPVTVLPTRSQRTQ